MDKTRSLSEHPVETLERLQQPRRSNRAHIEALPSELLFHLSRFLDLAGLIVFSTAASHALRKVFAQFDRELLFLEPAHRLNLAEWREAARKLERFGLTPSSCFEREVTDAESHCKDEIDLSQAVHQLTRDESLIDLHLLQSILVFLAAEDVQDFSNRASARMKRGRRNVVPSISTDSQSSKGVNQIRSLHLTGWHGIAGAFLIHQLRSQPSLRGVRTIVKTDRADSRIWQQAAADDRCSKGQGGNNGSVWSAHREHEVPRWPSRPWSTQGIGGSNMVVQFRDCHTTQIIVQVGKRRSRIPGQPFLRGEGLQMGFQGYCIDMATTMPKIEAGELNLSIDGGAVHADKRIDAEEGVSKGDSTMHSGPGPESDGALTGSACQDLTRHRLHVILQGREVEDAEQNEEMFERSLVSCNQCKARIVF
ncbi:hypothetical protein PHSY_003157 [Pseudozyma hubeiensis SY62]|uniref:F-box domain-containing protein n=1 Tax=Pseudozyma hubeiensis (strain SY62) TaxID=1305764 RepID=R9P2M4_PSEHS|nr:hypothetical protein PHSY_003157 [Pseudozyma hubeiensis SY62]GAC95581.1 hypothetical protein PHSY_003157 [Pseudozyma hubeiensis SY62]